jgi:hypothetical protein
MTKGRLRSPCRRASASLVQTAVGGIGSMTHSRFSESVSVQVTTTISAVITPNGGCRGVPGALSRAVGDARAEPDDLIEVQV